LSPLGKSVQANVDSVAVATVDPGNRRVSFLSRLRHAEEMLVPKIDYHVGKLPFPDICRRADPTRLACSSCAILPQPRFNPVQSSQYLTNDVCVFHVALLVDTKAY
jgi:hypothetical protein